MWNFKLKNNVKVDKNQGDSIKNSNITINSNDNQMIVEMYRVIGRLEGEFKAIKTDIKYIRNHIEEHNERLMKIEHSLFNNIERR